MLDYIKKITEILSYLAVVMGLLIAWYEYREQIHRTAKEHSISMAARFQEDRLLTARSSILNPWLNYNLEKFEKFAPSRSVIDQLVLKIVESNQSENSQQDMRTNIILITEFFDAAQVCIEARVCSSEILDKLIGKYSQRFYCLYRPVIEIAKKEAKLVKFGEKLEVMASRNGKCN